MASKSSAATTMDNQGEQMESVMISNVRYEVPKVVADLLKSSKSTSDLNPQVVSYNPSSTSVAQSAGVEDVGKKDELDISVVVGDLSVGVKNPREVDGVTEEEVNPEGVVKSGTEPATEEEVLDPLSFEIVRDVLKNPEGVAACVLSCEKTGDLSLNTTNAADVSCEKNVELKNPGGVADSLDTEFWFGCSQEKGNPPKDIGEPSVGAEKSKLNKTLDELEKMGNVAKFKESVDGDDADCEIVETSSTASKKKISRPTPLRQQPVRVSKRKLEEKEANTPKSTVKRSKKSAGKEILTEMECSEKFLLDEGLFEVYDLIKAQGWEKLCETQEFVCHEVIQEFYKNLSFIEGKIPALEVKFKGTKFILSSMELAMILEVDHKGFDLFCKNNQWPREAGNKQDLVKSICQLEVVSKGAGISTQFMEPNVKILHKLLVSNFLQRGVKPSYVQHQDLLVLDKLLKREKINLPKLLIHQIFHLKNLSQIGFSRVIKKILQAHELYENLSGVEEPVVKEFDPDVFRKMNLVKDAAQGWIRSSIPEPAFEPKLEFKDEEGDEKNDVFEDNSDKWLVALDKNISNVKIELKAVRTKLKEFKKEIKEEIEGVKDAIYFLQSEDEHLLSLRMLSSVLDMDLPILASTHNILFFIEQFDSMLSMHVFTVIFKLEVSACIYALLESS